MANILTKGGGLHWRIGMLVVLLAAVGWPLRTALRQLTGEAVAREAVQTVVRKLVPASAEVSRQVEVGRGSIAVRLVVTREISATEIEQAEHEIEQRTGRKADVSVQSVASQSELAGLMERLAAPVVQAPPPPPPKIVAVGDMRDELLARVKPALTTMWPVEFPVQSFALSLGSDAVVLEVSYSGEKALPPVAVGILQQELRSSLGSPLLSLQAKRVPLPKTKAEASKRRR